MANFVYNKAKALIATADLDLNNASTVIRALLVRSTSSYSANKDHDFLDSFTGGSGVEITVASYARITLANKAVNLDDTNDRAEFDMDDIAFGSLEAGQTVSAIIIYQQVGGSDATPENDPLIAWIDTDAGGVLPASLGGGTFTITINVEGLIQLT